MTTESQFDTVIDLCRKVFEAKFQEYGPSWRLLRPSALCDRIFTKAARVRTLEELGVGKVADTVESELVGIANYAIIFQDRLMHEGLLTPALDDRVAARWSDLAHAIDSYDAVVEQARTLLLDKDHDYGQAWRRLETTTFTDEIIGRTLRIKELLKQPSNAVQPVRAQNIDVLNYAVLAQIRLDEKRV